MKKIMSTFMLLLMISSNCFYYSFANEEELDDFEPNVILNETEWSEESIDIDWNSFFQEEWQSEESLENDEEQVEQESNTDLEVQIETEEVEDIELEVILEKENRWVVEEILEQLPNLIISEVFFGWNNERIEVYNAWDDFQWDLVLSGIYNGKSTRSFSDVSIENWETKIFWNPGAANVLWNIDYIISDPTLRIWDNTTFLISYIFHEYCWMIFIEILRLLIVMYHFIEL